MPFDGTDFGMPRRKNKPKKPTRSVGDWFGIVAALILMVNIPLGAFGTYELRELWGMFTIACYALAAIVTLTESVVGRFR